MRNTVTWCLAVSNLFAAVAGGWILSKSSGKLSALTLLDHFGPLMALVLGSLLGFLILQSLGSKGPSVTRFLPATTAAASAALLLIDQGIESFGMFVAWTYFAILSGRWASWAAARSVRGSLAAKFGKNPTVELCSFLGLVIGAELPNALELDIWQVLLADIVLQLAAFAIDFWASRLEAEVAPVTGEDQQQVSYPYLRAVATVIALVAGTQMVLFAARGALPQGILKQHLIAMVYLGGVLGALACIVFEAKILLPRMNVGNGPGRIPILDLKGIPIPLPLIALLSFVGVSIALLGSDTEFAPVGVVIATFMSTVVFAPTLNHIAKNAGRPMVTKAYGWMFFGTILCLATLSIALDQITKNMGGGPTLSDVSLAVLLGSSCVLILIGGLALVGTVQAEARIA